MTKNRGIPVTYAPKKAEKKHIDPKKLYKVDILAYDPLIGFITNVSTTLYEIQSQYAVDSEEYKECETRLKLCCFLQSAVIDAAKGIAFEGVPKHWIRPTKITDEMRETLSQEEIGKIEFNNKLAICKKRPYFMRYLYSHKNREYNEYLDDMNRICYAVWGKPQDQLTEQDKESIFYENLLKQQAKSNPLIMTDGLMNRLCRHMESQISELKKDRRQHLEETQEVFENIYDERVATDLFLLPKMEEVYDEYTEFKKSKQLTESEFITYEQYYSALRQKCLCNISNNVRECANLAVYICYKLHPKKSKSFCWDCFGSAILENVIDNNTAENDDIVVEIPHKVQNGGIEYLYKHYEFEPLIISKHSDNGENIENCMKCEETMAGELDDNI